MVRYIPSKVTGSVTDTVTDYLFADNMCGDQRNAGC